MATGTSSSYPPPPPYYRLYKDYLEDPESAPEPPPPVQGTYPLFGATYTTDVVLPSLEDQGVRQLYPKGPSIDFKRELTSLNRELQLHILELADVLVERPSQYARRVEDISLIFKNLHHLLNSLRPHQCCYFDVLLLGESNTHSHSRTSDTTKEASNRGYQKEERGGTKASQGITPEFGWSSGMNPVLL
ncbi:Mediator of RNA polymerase II transcription subunit [Musa troglodytarum]|uniref:Mediator of RNA polymerase II transcription subunit 7 n=1 Tax=Musa troglodytarum TaxID=320322 RepID=A0A9E7L7D4_9LILI|nr:Mediator of RNA polymerase II transcription subunit [Musa troglodytarum]